MQCSGARRRRSERALSLSPSACTIVRARLQRRTDRTAAEALPPCSTYPAAVSPAPDGGKEFVAVDGKHQVLDVCVVNCVQ